MVFNSVYYFHVHYGYEMETWGEKDEYGFIAADSFEDALKQLRGYYGDDMLNIALEYMGDTGLIAIGNKTIADTFKNEYVSYHYDFDKEDSE